MKFNTYDLGCGGGLRDPQAASESGFANFVFGWSKGWTALTVVMRQYATSDKLFGSLDPVVERATQAVRDAMFSPWIGSSLLILGIGIIWQARKRNMSDVFQQVAWALLVMTVATGVASYPVEASKFADAAINTTVNAIDRGIAGVDLNGSQEEDSTPSDAPGGLAPVAYNAAAPAAGPYGEPTGDRAKDQTAHGDMLVHSVLYQQWLRGTFGDDDSAVAKKYGTQLLDAQALTWREAKLSTAERRKVVTEKQERFQEIAEKVKNEDPTAYGFLTGKSGSRLGAAGTSNFQAAGSNTFSLVADLIIAAGKLTLRFIVILFPAIAVIGLHRRMSGTVRTSFESAMAACINVPLFAAGAGVHLLLVRELSDESVDLPIWFKCVILLLATVVLWKMLRPLTRLSSMMNPRHNYLADGGKAATWPGRALSGYAKYYVGSRAIRRLLGNRQGQAEALEEIDDNDGRALPGGRGGAMGDDPGHWSGADDWPYTRDGDSPDGPGGTGGGSGAMDPLYAEFGTDDDPASAGALGGEGRGRHHGFFRPGVEAGASRSDDDVWDTEGWFVEDLDRGTSGSAPTLPSGNGSAAASSNGAAAGSLPMPPLEPDGPLPLPGGTGGGAAAPIPGPRDTSAPAGTGYYPAPPSVTGTGHARVSGPAPVNGPGVDGMVPPAAPRTDYDSVAPEPRPGDGLDVIPPTLDPDGGGAVYSLYTPSDGFHIRDERGPEPEPDEDGGER